jgi:hypothetical protein
VSRPCAAGFEGELLITSAYPDAPALALPTFLGEVVRGRVVTVRIPNAPNASPTVAQIAMPFITGVDGLSLEP